MRGDPFAEVAQGDLFEVGEVALLAAGDHEQVLGELCEPVGLFAGGDERVVPFARFCVGVQGDVDLGFEDRQRGAQLVAGVADELPLLLCGRADAGEHVVERLAEAVDLVVGGREGQPGVGGGLGDVGGAAAHPVDGAQGASGDRVARQGGEQQRDREADEQHAAERLERALALAHRGGDGHDGARAGGAAEDARVLLAFEHDLAAAGRREMDRADQRLGVLDPGRDDHAAVHCHQLGGLTRGVQSGAQLARVFGALHELIGAQAQRVVELVVES